MSIFYRIVVCIIRPFFFIFHPYKIIGRENRPAGPGIVCANHTRLVDPVFVAFAFGAKHFVRFMAKQELGRIPVLGWLLTKVGVFYVDRAHSDIDAVRTAMKALKAGSKVMMFPEGRRVSSEDSVAAKTGAVRLAAKLGVPIIPVYIPAEKKMFRKTTVVIGEPYFIDRAGKAGSGELSAALMHRIYSLEKVKQ